MSELVFEVTQEGDGGFVAECLTESIFTEGDTWEQLRRNVQDAVEAFYFDGVPPASIRLPLHRISLRCAHSTDRRPASFARLASYGTIATSVLE